MFGLSRHDTLRPGRYALELQEQDHNYAKPLKHDGFDSKCKSFRCRIPAYRDRSLSLVHGTGYDSDMLNAIYYAVNHGAKVIDMSLNYSSSFQELDDAVSYANSMGVICVTAEGQ
jgi:hypothetical protein